MRPGPSGPLTRQSAMPKKREWLDDLPEWPELCIRRGSVTFPRPSLDQRRRENQQVRMLEAAIKEATKKHGPTLL